MLDERSWFVERREETQDESADAIVRTQLCEGIPDFVLSDFHRPASLRYAKHE